jgi:hypothetical protein
MASSQSLFAEVCQLDENHTAACHSSEQILRYAAFELTSSLVTGLSHIPHVTR